MSKDTMTASHDTLHIAHKSHKLPKLPRYRSQIRLRNPPESPRCSPRQQSQPNADSPTKHAEYDKSKLAANVLDQYNSIMQDKSSLVVRNLPPIKLSVKSNINHTETARDEQNNTARSTVSSHWAGNHVFTEGISEISKGPNPTFTMKAMRVPYSNLPDNVTIRKENDKFTFGVKTEENEIKYNKLSNRPYGLVDANIIHPIEVGQSLKAQKSYRNEHEKYSANTRLCGQLDALVLTGGTVTKLEGQTNTCITNSSVFPDIDTVRLTHSNISTKPNKKQTKDEPGQRRNWSHIERGESRIGVISIGDSVTPTHYDRPRRRTRKLYPMYDYKTVQKEAYSRLKFGIGNTSRAQSTINNTPSLSRLSTTKFDFRKENTDQSLTSNKHTTLKIKSSRRPRRLRLHNYDSELNVTNSRKLCVGRPQPPRSSESNSSTVLSQFPHNPPPSEISQLVAEEMGQMPVSNEMMTLQEERTMTASIKLGCETHVAESDFRNKDELENDTPFSGDTPHMATCNNLDSSLRQSLNEPQEQSNEEQTRTVQEIISVDRELTELPGRIDIVKDVILEDNESTPDENENSYFQERADMLCKREIEIVNKYKSQLQNCSLIKKEPKVQDVKTPRTLAVPTVSLELNSCHPKAQIVSHISNSVSRIMENSQINLSSKTEQKNEDMDNTLIDVKVAVPVTNITLNSDTTRGSIITPVLSVTDEFGDTYEEETQCKDENTDPNGQRIDEDKSNKKLLNNTNISFISPALVEPNAKRQ